jgi:hypothetical protein
MLATTPLDEEIKEGLTGDGFNINDVRSMQIARDGSEQRGVIREGADLVRNLLVFCGDELDEDSAKLILRAAFGFLHVRRRSGKLDDVEFVTVYGSDNRSVLMQVPVPRTSIDPASG